MRALAQAVNESGEALLTPALIGERWAVRVSLGGTATERQHVEAVWQLLRSKASG